MQEGTLLLLSFLSSRLHLPFLYLGTFLPYKAKQGLEYLLSPQQLREPYIQATLHTSGKEVGRLELALLTTCYTR